MGSRTGETPSMAQVRSANYERRRKENDKTAEILRALVASLDTMAEALERDDDMLGAMAGMGIGSLLPELPKHVRDVFMEYLSDEAAAGAKADRLYIEQVV